MAIGFEGWSDPVSYPKYDRRRLRGIARIIVNNPNTTVDLSDLGSEDLETLYKYLEEERKRITRDR